MKDTLQVGIIGASADRGWARDSHVPAVQQLGGLELGAVLSTDQAKADAAAKAFGARAAYSSPAELFADPAISIVTIAVKVPDHRRLVLAAAAAGKHIYCEWPLGRDLAETQELATAARNAGIHVAIGLQTRANSAVHLARQQLASGVIGRPLSARVLSTTLAFGPEVEPAMAFGEYPANGVTLVTVQGAHTVDLALSLLRPFGSATALASTVFPQFTVTEKDVAAKPQPRSTPDHLLVQASAVDDLPLNIEVAGGRPPDETPFHFEIAGERGTLTLTGGAPRGFQSGRLELFLNGKPQPLGPDETTAMSDSAANVAGVYVALRDDIRNNTRTAPDFEHAVRLTALMDDLLASSRSGIRATSGNWPTR